MLVWIELLYKIDKNNMNSIININLSISDNNKNYFIKQLLQSNY